MTQQITPSLEQSRIISHVTTSRKSLLVSALAGSAKTTTICLAANAMSELPSQAFPTLALAFNTRIKLELEERLPKSVQCLTFNGLGHRAWGSFLRKKLELHTGKCSGILTKLLAESRLQISPDEFSSILSVTSSCKSIGYLPKIPNTPVQFYPLHDSQCLTTLFFQEELDLTENNIFLVNEVLSRSTQQALAGNIDFADQVLLPTICPSVSFPKYSTIFVDEAQDLSPLNHRQLQKIGQPSSQYLIFGDPHQSIYAFRGADCDGMETLAALFNADRLDLTTSFRCPEAICAEVRKHVPAILSGNKNPGSVHTWQSWSIHALFTNPSTAMLCRNNAPLFTVAGLCLREALPIRILGRDIGNNLIKVVKKAHPLAPDNIHSALSTYFKREMAKAAEGKLLRLREQRDCLVSLLTTMLSPTADSLCSTIAQLFADNSNLPTLSSGHKAKGLEWTHIFHLDSFRIPARFAHTEAELRQEENLRYVITTRAKRSITYVNLRDLIELEQDPCEQEQEFVLPTALPAPVEALPQLSHITPANENASSHPHAQNTD